MQIDHLEKFWSRGNLEPEAEKNMIAIENLSNEDLIIEIAQNKSRKAYAALFNNFAPRIKSFVMGQGLNAIEAEDLAQDAMLLVLINEFPDYSADQSAGKRTIVARLGKKNSSLIFAGIVAISFVVLLALPFLDLPFPLWLGLSAAVPAFSAAKRLLAHPEKTDQIIARAGWHTAYICPVCAWNWRWILAISPVGKPQHKTDRAICSLFRYATAT